MTVSDNTLAVAESLSGDFLQELQAHEGSSPLEVAESPDGSKIASCGTTRWILWDAATGERLVDTPTDNINSISFDPDGQSVLTSGSDGLVRWPISGDAVGEPSVLIEGPCNRSAISPTGHLIAVVRSRRALLLGADGELRELGYHPGLDRVAFSPDGSLTAIGSWSGTGVRVWATDSGKLVAHLHPEARSSMATFSPDGHQLVIADSDVIEVYRTDTWTSEHVIAREGPRHPSLPPAFTPNGAMIAIGISRDRIRLLATDDWRTLADLRPARRHNLFHMRFIAGNNRLAVATPDHRVLIWELTKIWAELGQRGLIDSPGIPRRSTK